LEVDAHPRFAVRKVPLRRASAAADTVRKFENELATHAIARATDNRPQNVTPANIDDAAVVVYLSSNAAGHGVCSLRRAVASVFVFALGLVLSPLSDNTARTSTIWWVELVSLVLCGALWVGVAIRCSGDAR
jgi:hypothetical protein